MLVTSFNACRYVRIAVVLASLAFLPYGTPHSSGASYHLFAVAGLTQQQFNVLDAMPLDCALPEHDKRFLEKSKKINAYY